MKIRRLVIWACLVVGMAGAGDAREMPEEVRRFLENYLKDPNASWGFSRVKQRIGLCDSSVQLKDLSVRALEIYRLKHGFLNTYPDTIPFSEIIEPTSRWLVVVMAHNKPLYKLNLDNIGEKPGITRASIPPRGSNFGCRIWDPLLKAYPESTGINPILFEEPGHRGESVLYFQQNGPRKIHNVSVQFERSDNPIHTMNPSLMLFTGSIETLDDSKKLIRHWKSRGINEVGINPNPENIEHQRRHHAAPESEPITIKMYWKDGELIQEKVTESHVPGTVIGSEK